MSAGDAALAAVLQRDRMIALSALAAISALAWAYLFWFAAGMGAAPSGMAGMDMPDMPGMAAAGFAPGDATRFLVVFAMWTVMMVGMMVPSAAPMILIHQQVARRSAAAGRPFAPSLWFALGYLAIWTLLALASTLAQYGLERRAALWPMSVGASRVFGTAAFIAFGLYQWTPIKQACLSQCRAPLSFIQGHGGFKPDGRSSLRLGVLHGGYCLGCCWAVMALLFVVGVMNLAWVAAIMVFVLAEKASPAGHLIGRAAGALAIAVGLWRLAG